MQFTINNSVWNIRLANEAEMNNEMKSDGTLGITIYGTQEILLLDKQVNILRTLKHELTHVWLWEYGHNQNEKEFNKEDICEIVASSNNFVNEVVEEFKKEMEKK